MRVNFNEIRKSREKTLSRSWDAELEREKSEMAGGLEFAAFREGFLKKRCSSL